MRDSESAAAALLFDGGRLTQARHLRRRLKGEVAADVGVTAAAIGQFERGDVRPRPATVAKLAMALALPPRFFSQRPRFAVPEDEAHFRKLRSTSKKDRDQARARVELLAELTAGLERRVRLPAVELPALSAGASPEDAAKATRSLWGLGTGPAASVVGFMERKGVIVARLHAESDDVDAFSCWIGGRPYVLLTNNKDAPDRSRFDAAHELGHIVLHQDALPGDSEIEQQAHRFAAEFLMPAASIVRELPERLNWRGYVDLKARWGVSIAALVRRSRDLDVISDAAYKRAMIEIGRRGWRTREPEPPMAVEEPELLMRALDIVESSRRVQLSDLAVELALPVSDLQLLTSMAGASAPLEQLSL
jgi:Zn-dependent peptidase ImmA (M78 family)/transcriptional regulator with XRE-family HTH domain